MRHPFDTGSIQTIVMIACDKDFVPVIQCPEPLDKIGNLFLRPVSRQVPCMNQHVGLRQILQLTVFPMRVG